MNGIEVENYHYETAGHQINSLRNRLEDNVNIGRTKHQTLVRH
ncbi:hypothetical protein ACAG39_11940 [Caldicellulosiruptoraceae bacterium PP1]